MKLSVLTPDRAIFDGEVKSVKVPGTNGEFEILPKHAPLVSSLDAGLVRILGADGNRTEFSIGSGFIEVLNDNVSLLIQGYKA